jgi:hypothetical protein
VKKWQLVLYPNRSGVPKALRFSSRVNVIFLKFFLISCQSFVSGFNVVRPSSKLYPSCIFPAQLWLQVCDFL